MPRLAVFQLFHGVVYLLYTVELGIVLNMYPIGTDVRYAVNNHIKSSTVCIKCNYYEKYNLSSSSKGNAI